MMKLVLWESVLAKTMMMKFNTIAKYARTFRISRMEQNDRQMPNVANARILLNANLVAHNPNLTRFYLLKIWYGNFNHTKRLSIFHNEQKIGVKTSFPLKVDICKCLCPLNFHFAEWDSNLYHLMLTLFFPILPFDAPEENVWFPDVFRGIKRKYWEENG